jgi:hypothetical protein
MKKLIILVYDRLLQDIQAELSFVHNKLDENIAFVIKKFS